MSSEFKVLILDKADWLESECGPGEASGYQFIRGEGAGYDFLNGKGKGYGFGGDHCQLENGLGNGGGYGRGNRCR